MLRNFDPLLYKVLLEFIAALGHYAKLSYGLTTTFQSG